MEVYEKFSCVTMEGYEKFSLIATNSSYMFLYLAAHLHNANRVKNVPYGILRIKKLQKPSLFCSTYLHTCIYRPDMGLIPPRTAIPQYVQRLK